MNKSRKLVRHILEIKMRKNFGRETSKKQTTW